ncbi:MAG: 2-oxo-4-hydroxy-4-carboxy-5-ureidoimidazoline decarboxylase [Ignavibacteria bacterium]|nr:2-oxo-4-hydroxy-4-carboxy-5-ureidoimidazoline decarboxylase [Ignavibacteria bacterium]
MSLDKFNDIKTEDRKDLFSKCCGSEKWIGKMVSAGQFSTREEMTERSQRIWYSLDECDWLEAFRHHPKIGDMESLKRKFSATQDLAENEQSSVKEASAEILFELAKYNEDYEKKFGYIFIVCATGKSAEEMLSLIKERIKNDPETEIRIAMEEQNKITKLRLEKLL